MDWDWMKLTAGKMRRKRPDGTQLRLLSAMEVLEARREAIDLVQEDRERALCANACILARALERNGKPVCQSGEEILHRYTVSQIQSLAREWAEFDREENPGPAEEEGRIDALKKAWSTCRMSALNGVCSAVLERFLPKNESKK